ncbi:pyridoxamine 5'-phosphate oxidase-domain-containing protein [Pilobolus umbonatus]|nr:pyridoxamine 5'-phosphate oxidase-domain-containing protein [Pilobolus umbonatus]
MDWKRKILTALKENIEQIGLSSNYASLATVRPDNTPAVRTVVMRGFVGENHSYETGWNSDLLCITTDKYSNKIKEIQHNNHVELCWYMNGTGEQFRIRGKVHILDDKTSLDTLNSHLTKNNRDVTGTKLELQSFLKTDNIWTAERYRHFIATDPSQRARQVKDIDQLEINELDEHGRFKNDAYPDLLEEAYERFVLLVVEVTSVRHWSLSTGSQTVPGINRKSRPSFLNLRSSSEFEALRKGGTQGDIKSVKSPIESIHSPHNKKRLIKRQPPTPTEVFTKNLNDAVLDVEDYNGYVYQSGLSSTEDEGGYFFTNHHPRDMKSFYLEPSYGRSEKRRSDPKRYHYASIDRDDETITSYYTNKRSKRPKKSCCFYCSIIFLSFAIISLVIVFLTRPLEAVEVVSVSNVLGTQKQLIFDLNVKASNPNLWKIPIIQSTLSLFAASHYVPTLMSNTSSYVHMGKKQEYLGTVKLLEDPLLFDASSLFSNRLSVSTSQIQIKSPGSTKDDSTGNERWSLIIRYPYELTIRGILKYHLLPWDKGHSVRVCKDIQVNPLTGKISDIPYPDQSICEDSVPPTEEYGH